MRDEDISHRIRKEWLRDAIAVYATKIPSQMKIKLYIIILRLACYARANLKPLRSIISTRYVL